MSGDVRTLGRLFLDRMEKSGSANAVGWLENDQIKFINYGEYFETVRSISLALKTLGIGVDKKASILGNTRKEWHFADLGIMMIRGVTIPIYHTYTHEEIKYIFNHSDSTVFFIENDEQLEKVIQVQDDLTNLEAIISFDEFSQTNINKLNDKVKLLTFDELIKIGKEEAVKDPEFFEKNLKEQDDQELASIIYTSGTTGEPKGAVITQRAFASMCLNVKDSIGNLFNAQDRTMTWLPLSHVFGRCESMFTIVFGWEMVFSRGVDHLLVDLGIVKPTLLMAVPRIFEKIYAKIHEQINEGSAIKKTLFNWAKGALSSYHSKLDKDLSPSTGEIIQAKLAYKLVFSKVYEKFGGRVRFFVSGGAPISVEIINFLKNANLVIIEGYGLTETVAPCMLNPPQKPIPGTVGTPLGDVEIGLADDGEILIKSEAMLKEYYKNPEATAEAIKDGWFYSGDIGEFTADGYLKITDRKKDIIITSGGKNIAPQKIENMLKIQKYIAQSVVVGDKRKYLTVLVGIEKEPFLSHLDEMGLSESCTVEDIAKHEKTQKLIEDNISSVNRDLASFETIKKFYVVPEEFTVDNGFVTPSLKVRKKNVMSAYEKEIEGLY